MFVATSPGEEEEEEEEMNCTNTTTFQTKSRNPSGKIIIFLLIAEWNNIIVHLWVWVCVEWGLSKWVGLGVDECEVNCLFSTFLMLHLLCYLLIKHTYTVFVPL